MHCAELVIIQSCALVSSVGCSVVHCAVLNSVARFELCSVLQCSPVFAVQCFFTVHCAAVYSAGMLDVYLVTYQLSNYRLVYTLLYTALYCTLM